MKKQLPTDAISNELAQSVFFPKSPIARSNDRTGARVITPPPQQASNRTTEVANGRPPERVTPPPPVKAIPRSRERPNGRTDKEELPEKTERYSFEIYPTQQERIEEYLYH